LAVVICQGVKAVIAESFDERHRQALVGVGVLPLEFVNGETAQSLELTGKEKFTITLGSDLVVKQHVTITVSMTVTDLCSTLHIRTLFICNQYVY